jgi:predicted membrane channel-forming protein YqfA (hemolysin III family)
MGAPKGHRQRSGNRIFERRATKGYMPRAMTEPSPRKLAGIALILLLILAWASFVASLAPVVGKWPVLLQAPYYLFMGVAWVIPLKPLIRWVETGSFRGS